MNKLISKFYTLTATVWFLLSSVLMVLGAYYFKEIRTLIGKPGTYVPVYLYVLGGCLLLFIIIVALFKLFGFKKRKEVHYANAIGEIAISLSAIEEALGRLLDDKDLVRAHEVTIFDSPHEKKLKVTARLSMWEVSDLPAKVADIQQELKRRFEEIMPDAEAVEFHVKLSSFLPRKEKARKETAGKEEAVEENRTEETDYFTGLKYPIEEESEDEE